MLASKPVMDVGRGYRAFPLRHADLVQPPYHVAGGIEAIDAGLLVIVDAEAAAFVGDRAQAAGKLALRCRSQRRVDHLEAMLGAGDVEGLDRVVRERHPTD